MQGEGNLTKLSLYPISLYSTYRIKFTHPNDFGHNTIASIRLVDEFSGVMKWWQYEIVRDI